ncbi:MAG: hypothetical protein ACE5Z5_00410 [Candidatus Bathyarchaeia archaeon]
MPARRVKVDIFDSEGNKITISFEGNITRNKVLKILDLVELLGGGSVAESEEGKSLIGLSKIEKAKRVIEQRFPIGWFSSQELQTAYEDLIKEPIGLSTVSTYLSRLADRGMLTRAGSSAGRRYRLKSARALQRGRSVQP